MDVTSPSSSCDVTEGGAGEDPNRLECITSQPAASEPNPLQTTDEAPPPLPVRSEDGHLSDESVTGSSSSSSSTTNDAAPLMSSQHTGVDSTAASPAPICAQPSAASSSSSQHSGDLHRHRHHRQSTNQEPPSSSSKRDTSMKTDAVHIKEVAGDDCCVHCLLACLFCELLSMCSAMGECLACGLTGTGCCDTAIGCCCCCVEAAGDPACTEEACQAVLDCGIVDDCCGSSDCLEICMEFCSICFPA